MSSESKTRPTEVSIDTFLESVSDKRREESRLLIDMMRKISGEDPCMWGPSIIGFGTKHYKYDSGREGDGFILGFYPRKGKTTIYMMDGTTRYAELLAKLGKHTITGYCVYIKQLKDIELPVLEEILQKSYKYIKSLSKDGPIDRILWKDAA